MAITKPLILAASATQNTATTVTQATATVLDAAYSLLTIIVNVTAAATGAGDTLSVFVDTSFDGGSTWVNIGLATFVGNGGAKKSAMAFAKSTIAGTQPVDISADLASANTRNIGFGDQIRYRGTTAASANYTYSVTGYARV